MNAIQMLKDDHKRVRGLLAELRATSGRAAKKRAGLLASIERELKIHTTLEEEIFYPAFKAAGEGQADALLYFAAVEEHRAVDDLVLPDLKGTVPGGERFAGRAKVLKELIEHHADEEERVMFPRARALLGAAELRDLGLRMAERKLELQKESKGATVASKISAKVMGAVGSLAAGAEPAPTATAGRRRTPVARRSPGSEGGESSSRSR